MTLASLRQGKQENHPLLKAGPASKRGRFQRRENEGRHDLKFLTLPY